MSAGNPEWKTHQGSRLWFQDELAEEGRVHHCLSFGRGLIGRDPGLLPQGCPRAIRYETLCGHGCWHSTSSPRSVISRSFWGVFLTQSQDWVLRFSAQRYRRPRSGFGAHYLAVHHVGQTGFRGVLFAGNWICSGDSPESWDGEIDRVDIESCSICRRRNLPMSSFLEELITQVRVLY